MINVLVLCGGESGEHEVSLRSASSILKNLPKDQFRAIPVGITKEGRWVKGEPFFHHENSASEIMLNPDLPEVYLKNDTIDGEKIDAVFSIIHGTYGEDGCLQGLFQLNHLPYVGPNVLGSAVGMDKDVMKRLLSQAGIQNAKSVTLNFYDEIYPTYEEIESKLGSTIFVKPCNLGSSVGISKVRNEEEYKTAIEFAFQYDTKVLIEEFIQGREIELAVLGYSKIEVSKVAGEVIPKADFYSYEAKYLDDGPTTDLVMPAKLTEGELSNLQEIALKAFRVLECAGLARVDFFLTKNSEIYLNEINTLPGFTSISMYPKLWAHSGLPYSELLTKLITLAIEQRDAESKLKRSI
ncbi:MAG: D-alanine-D-alanine ligase [bacterium]|jgi:D-alanine-D-alanine ligase